MQTPSCSKHFGSKTDLLKYKASSIPTPEGNGVTPTNPHTHTHTQQTQILVHTHRHTHRHTHARAHVLTHPQSHIHTPYIHYKHTHTPTYIYTNTNTHSISYSLTHREIQCDIKTNIILINVPRFPFRNTFLVCISALHMFPFLTGLLLHQSCFTSTDTTRTIRDREPRTSTSIFTQFLSSERRCSSLMLLYVHRDHVDY